MNSTTWPDHFYNLAVAAVRGLERRTDEEQKVATVVVGVSLGTAASVLLVLAGCLAARLLPACLACARGTRAASNVRVSSSLDSDASSEDEEEGEAAAAREAQKRSRKEHV